MAPTLQPFHPQRQAPLRAHCPRPDSAPPPDDELRALKRELTAAKDRFLRLAQDAERARLAATAAETHARSRLDAAVEILSRARSESASPPLATAVENALNALRSVSASLPPASPPAN